MKTIKHYLIISFLLCFSVSQAGAANKVDDTVASGIIFKVVYIFGCHGTWSDINSNTSEEFDHMITVIRKNLDLFSDSDYGQNLKKHGEFLITFLDKLVKSNHINQEIEEFFRSINIDINDTSPVTLAEAFMAKIDEYAEMSNTPPWVYQFKRD